MTADPMVVVSFAVAMIIFSIVYAIYDYIATSREKKGEHLERH